MVLDFQSLYPSIVIAYNMCYSTVLGRLSASQPAINAKLGFMQYQPPAGALQAGYGGMWQGSAVRRNEAPTSTTVRGTGHRAHRPPSTYISPNGVLFAPWSQRRGILPRMLQELLDTRVMVKNAMKGLSGKPGSGQVAAMRMMHARQFALKMISNVTYGYTAAGFSGRMPCAEIADAIVQTARTTLERAIRLIESHPTWRARVVYGDTDSMFVLLPGRSVDDAFKIGAQIADEVTARNPRPVTLKMEKVYHPCVLVAKKRYAGFMYESPSQTVPSLDCKGLEMVRRDTCGLVAKTMERSMRLMFSTMDLSAVKAYLTRTWCKMLEGRVLVQDYVFAKEVRLGTYSARGPLPPAAVVASKAMIADPRAEPRFGERIPFVVITGDPGARLVDLVVTPYQLLRSNGSLRLNNTYYITKQVIPALDRIFSLVGADLKAWFTDMRRPVLRRMRAAPTALGLPASAAAGARTLLVPDGDDGEDGSAMAGTSGGAAGGSGRSRWSSAGQGGGSTGTRTIDGYYMSESCDICGRQCRGRVCEACLQDPQQVAFIAIMREAAMRRSLSRMEALCQTCTSIRDPSIRGASACNSLDCPVFYERARLGMEGAQLARVVDALGLR